MDKWKDIELQKMKVGGNKKAKQFLESQPDWDQSMPLSERYNSKAAALYRDKVLHSLYSRFKNKFLYYNRYQLKLRERSGRSRRLRPKTILHV